MVTRMSEEQGGVGKQRIDPVTQYFKLLRSTSKNPPKLTRPVPKMPVPSLEKAQKQGYMGYQRGIPTGPDGRKKRRTLAVPSLGAQISREVVNRGWEHDLANGWVMGNWENLVGERIAAHTQPQRIKDKVVYVSCDNSTWATELRYLQRQILRKISDRLGPDVIVELRIHGPKQQRNYEGRQWVKPQGSQDTYG